MPDAITISRECAEYALRLSQSDMSRESSAYTRQLEAALRSGDGWVKVPDDHWWKKGDELRGRYEGYVRITHYRRLSSIDKITKAKPK